MRKRLEKLFVSENLSNTWKRFRRGEGGGKNGPQTTLRKTQAGNTCCNRIRYSRDRFSSLIPLIIRVDWSHTALNQASVFRPARWPSKAVGDIANPCEDGFGKPSYAEAFRVLKSQRGIRKGAANRWNETRSFIWQIRREV